MTARLTVEQLRTRVVVTDSGCWEYQGRDANAGGYRYAGGDWAHRTAYRLYVGEIPDGYHVDHLCMNRICVAPTHLEAVTPAENARRARLARTHCGNGHEWNEANTRISPRGFRECRSCHRDREAERKRRIRDGLASHVVKPEQHGTATGYMYGCRCDRCRAANAAVGRAYRAKQRALRDAQRQDVAA